MKRSLVLMGMCFALLVTQAPAAETFNYVYVDLQTILQQSKAGKKEKDKITKFIKKRQVEFKKEEKALEAMQKKYEKDKLTLSKSQKQERQKAFQGKLKAYRKKAAESEQEVKRKEAAYANKALYEIQKIVEKMAKDKKYDVVVEKTQSGLLYVARDKDITKEVMEVFDKKFTN